MRALSRECACRGHLCVHLIRASPNSCTLSSDACADVDALRAERDAHVCPPAPVAAAAADLSRIAAESPLVTELRARIVELESAAAAAAAAARQSAAALDAPDAASSAPANSKRALPPPSTPGRALGASVASAAATMGDADSVGEMLAAAPALVCATCRRIGHQICLHSFAMLGMAFCVIVAIVLSYLLRARAPLT